MEGQAPCAAAAGRDDIHILIALVAGGEGNPFSVRREARHHILARVAGQPRRRPATLADRPEIATRDEDDGAIMFGGIAHEGMLGLGRGGLGQAGARQQQGR